MRAKETVMDLEQEIERIAKKYGLATVKVVGGKRLMFTCEHGRCSGCDCACHGDTERHIEETVNPEAIEALREMAAFTRKHTLEELRGMCLEIQFGGCDKIKTAYPCRYCYAAYRLEKEKGEEQPL